jgi:hypothetical protein
MLSLTGCIPALPVSVSHSQNSMDFFRHKQIAGFSYFALPVVVFLM